MVATFGNSRPSASSPTYPYGEVYTFTVTSTASSTTGTNATTIAMPMPVSNTSATLYGTPQPPRDVFDELLPRPRWYLWYWPPAMRMPPVEPREVHARHPQQNDLTTIRRTRTTRSTGRWRFKSWS